MIEKVNPYIEKLLRKEPWRAEYDGACDTCVGDIHWDGSQHWHCRMCGRISKMNFLGHVLPPKSQAIKDSVIAALRD